ncbi:hypothetical protein JTE90_028126 [Oedothorax gibbosus]|uniref:Uncharacterized protein n=1 Tax=Oedothorax gibbosus TaxID=931172 RepID=A0AAV6VBE3_9ARAC|nr:hypothetical protein JTE90_028126 [Oedothorax gibbosus]
MCLLTLYKPRNQGIHLSTLETNNNKGSVPEVVPSDRPVDGRLTFHPTKELPLMRDWFHSCRNPSRRTLQMYVDLLNQGSVRQQERPKVAVNTLKNWWKNEKQRERKNQKSDDQTDEPSKPKRKKSSDDSQAKTDPPDENGSHTFSNSDSQDTPPKANNKFTLINHSESESDIYRVEEIHPKDISENSLAGDSVPHIPRSSPPKDNFKFTLSHTDHEVVTVPDNRLNEHIIHPILPMKDSIDSPFFHKLHPVCIDHPHGLFGFPDHHLGMPGGNKIFGDSESSGRTNLMEESNSHMSSEDDVDVGM